MKPIIGITSNYKNSGILKDSSLVNQDWQILSNEYINPIINAGGVPIIIPVLENESVLKEILNNIDGLFITGGSDINPLLYNKRADFNLKEISEKRDKSEIFCTNYIIHNLHKPFLGICRGMQILNVAFGGSLYTDLSDNNFNNHSLLMYERTEPSHFVNIKKESILYEIFNKKEIKVNSRHHQGIERLGANLISTAISDDNLCEAVESTLNSFVLGLQWHPESMSIKYYDQQKIFDRFILECK